MEVVECLMLDTHRTEIADERELAYPGCSDGHVLAHILVPEGIVELI